MGVGVGVGVGVDVVAAVTSMPSTSALSRLVVKLTAILPEESAVAVKVRAMALFFPPAAAKTSKLLSTVVPLTATLKERCPAAVHQFSQKSRRTL